MESLFKLSDLETRFPVNMNVLDARGAPRVMGLKAALQAFLDHRREVLVRRARFRLGKIEQRLHILDGLLIVFLNLDEVIRIVRFEDEPKAKLIERLRASTDIQADAILNTRLRQLAKLEEMELRREHADARRGARRHPTPCWPPTRQQWKLVGVGLRDVREDPGPDDRASARAARPSPTRPTIDAVGRRRGPGGARADHRHPLRARLDPRRQGRVEDPSELKFKEGDKLAFLVPAETTDKLLLFASDGRFFTLAVRQAAVGARAGRAAAPDARPRRPGRHPRRLRRTSPARKRRAGLARPATASSCRRTRRWPSAAPASRC